MNNKIYIIKLVWVFFWVKTMIMWIKSGQKPQGSEFPTNFEFCARN